ncbi:MAG: S-layer homology domain-containing protein [Clostridia bacterium]|nr:S-layer homology domain-containing protein [Clostridia bacterium]
MKKPGIILAFILSINTVCFAHADNFSGWARADINKAKELKLIPYELQEQYKENITREEFCELAVNLLRVKNEDIIENSYNDEIYFSDTDNENIIKAASLGIVSGVGDNKFNPKGKITRQEAAKMLYNTLDAGTDVLKEYKADNKNGVNGIFLPHIFNDSAEINNWARNEIYAMYHLGIMFGSGDNSFSPLEPYTIEQAVSTFLRLYNAFEDVNKNNMPEPEIYPDLDTANRLNGGNTLNAAYEWGSEGFIYEPKYYDGFGNVYSAGEKGYIPDMKSKYMAVVTARGVGVYNEVVINKEGKEVTGIVDNGGTKIIFDNMAVIHCLDREYLFYLYNLDTGEEIMGFDDINWDEDGGMYRFFRKGRVGYMNSEFKEIMPCQYINIDSVFFNSHIILQKPDKTFIIAKSDGSIIKSFKINHNKYEVWQAMGTNIILRDKKKDTKVLLKSYSGKYITNYTAMNFADNGDIIAQKEGKVYLLDKEGNLKADIDKMGYDTVTYIPSAGFYRVNKIDKSNWSNVIPYDIMDINCNLIRKGITRYDMVSDGCGMNLYKSAPNQLTVFDSYGKDIGVINTKDNIVDNNYWFVNGLVFVRCEKSENESYTEYYAPWGERAVVNCR